MAPYIGKSKKVVYVLTKGDYSDYHIIGVYSTRDEAEKGVIEYDSEWGTPSIEEWDVDKHPAHPEGMLAYKVHMDRDGNSEVHREGCDDFKGDDWAPYGDNQRVSFRMWARDEQHAVKIANERRMQQIASGQWMTDWEAWRKKYHPDKRSA